MKTYSTKRSGKKSTYRQLGRTEEPMHSKNKIDKNGERYLLFDDRSGPSPFSSELDFVDSAPFDKENVKELSTLGGKKPRKNSRKDKRPSTSKISEPKLKAKQSKKKIDMGSTSSKTRKLSVALAEPEMDNIGSKKHRVTNKDDTKCRKKGDFVWEDDDIHDDSIELFRKEEPFTWQQKMDLLLPKMFGSAQKEQISDKFDGMNLSAEDIEIDEDESSSEYDDTEDGNRKDIHSGDPSSNEYTYVWTTDTGTNTESTDMKTQTGLTSGRSQQKSGMSETTSKFGGPKRLQNDGKEGSPKSDKRLRSACLEKIPGIISDTHQTVTSRNVETLHGNKKTEDVQSLFTDISTVTNLLRSRKSLGNNRKSLGKFPLYSTPITKFTHTDVTSAFTQNLSSICPRPVSIATSEGVFSQPKVSESSNKPRNTDKLSKLSTVMNSNQKSGDGESDFLMPVTRGNDVPYCSTPVPKSSDRNIADAITEDLSSIESAGRHQQQLESTPKTKAVTQARTPKKQSKFYTSNHRPLQSTVLFISQRNNVTDAVTTDISTIRGSRQENQDSTSNRVTHDALSKNQVAEKAAAVPSDRVKPHSKQVLTSTPTKASDSAKVFKEFEMDLSSVPVEYEELQPEESTIVNSMEIVAEDDDNEDTHGVYPWKYKSKAPRLSEKDTSTLKSDHKESQNRPLCSTGSKGKSASKLSDDTDALIENIERSCAMLDEQERVLLQVKLQKVKNMLEKSNDELTKDTDQTQSKLPEKSTNQIYTETHVESTNELSNEHQSETAQCSSLEDNFQGQNSVPMAKMSKPKSQRETAISKLSNIHKYKMYTGKSSVNVHPSDKVLRKRSQPLLCDEDRPYCDLGKIDLIPMHILTNWPKRRIRSLRKKESSLSSNYEEIEEDCLTRFC